MRPNTGLFMKILQICSKVPFPPKDGGSIAMNMITHGLIAAGNDVQVLAVNTPKHFIKEDDLDAAYRIKTSFRSVFIDTSVKPLNAILNLFTGESYNITRFYSKEFERTLIGMLTAGKYEVVLLEALWVTVYLDVIRKYSDAKIIFRSHNTEFQIWERLASDAESPLKRMYLNLLAKRLKKYEVGMLNRYDAIAAISEADADCFKKLGCRIPIIHIPFGIDLQRYKVDRPNQNEQSLFHIGAMDWLPNADGVKWFLNNAWIGISAKHPSLKLYLAGKSMPDWLRNLHMKNVMVKGEVPDAREFMNSGTIMIVPLSSGSGMRVKIIEGMALGKTIVSTSVGAEGIAYENGKNILIADTTEGFSDAIDKCLSDRSFSENIGRNARILVETKYDNQVLCNRLSDFLKSIK